MILDFLPFLGFLFFEACLTLVMSSVLPSAKCVPVREVDFCIYFFQKTIPVRE